VKVVVVLPTYNGHDNVASLLAALAGQRARLAHELHVLVVDDGSPDGTAGRVRELQRCRDDLHLLEGRKRGLGVAYLRGFRYAMDALGADVVCQMDADWSHDPADLPRLLAALEAGADVAIGSRYVPGGSVPADWPRRRKLASLLGNLTARYVAGLYRVRDCTAGFRAIRASLLRHIDLERMRVQGYAFQVALLRAAVVAGGCVREVPVRFVDRAAGESKLGLSDIVEFLINAWWIRLESGRTFIKFALVGASGVVVNLGCFSALLAAGVSKYLASPIAIETSIVSNFLLNNYWTFRRRTLRSRKRVRGLKFNLVSFFSLGVSYGTFVALSLAFPAGTPHVHQIIGILPATGVNYFLNSYWTFRSDARP